MNSQAFLPQHAASEQLKSEPEPNPQKLSFFPTLRIYFADVANLEDLCDESDEKELLRRSDNTSPEGPTSITTLV